MSINCVDVSSYQGKINWSKVKASGVDYAILRSVTKGLNTDKFFEANYAGATAAGIKVGVYLFSYADDVNYAKREAKATVDLLKGKKIDLPVFYDLETESLRAADATKLQSIASAYQKIIEDAGFTFGIYCDESFYNAKNHFVGFDSGCEFWIAKYGKNDGAQHTLPSIKHHLIAHQFSSRGNVPGISGGADVSNWYGAKKKVSTSSATTSTKTGKTEAELRKGVAEFGMPYVGLKEGDAKHKKILSTFNNVYKGYTVKTSDAWCQTYASTAGIANGLTDIIPVECSCGRAIELWKKLGCWHENDGYKPSVGDYIYYDWDDNGSGDDTGWPEHVGIVFAVSGNTIKVIEGNIKDSVGYRTITVNGKYIRGYGVPDYKSKATSVSSVVKSSTSSNSTKNTVKQKDVVSAQKADKFDKSIAGTYKVTAERALNVRNGAGTGYSVMVAIPRGTPVKNYGYYNVVDGKKWLYVQFTYGDTQYTGFASSAYLKKQ